MAFPLAGLGAVAGSAAQAYEDIGQKEAYQRLAKLQILARQRQMLLQQQQQQADDLSMQALLGGGMGAQPNLFGQPAPGGQGGPNYAPGQIQAQSLNPPPTLPQIPSYGASGGMPTNPQLDLARKAIAQGYPPAAAAGMVGSMTGESGQNLDPYALNPTSGAMGRAQWLGPRAQALKASYGAQPTGDQQDQFLFSELRGPEAGTGQTMMGETDPRQAARDFTTGFERPGKVPMQGREAAAEQIYSQLSPTEQRQSTETSVDAATAVPPQFAGRMGLRQVAQLVDRTAGPGVPNHVKFAAVANLYKMMNEGAKAEFDQKLKMYEFGIREHDKELDRREHAREFGIREQDTRSRDKATAEYRRQRLAQGGAGGESLEASKMYEITDKESGETREVLAREGKKGAGFIDSATGKPIQYDPAKETIKQVTAGSSGGGRLGAQLQRQLTGGKEVALDLKSVVSLPVGTTTGFLGDVHPGTTITGALKGDLSRQLTTEDEAFMKASMSGFQRELSTLISPVYGGKWAAEQLDALTPRAGQTVANAMFQIARIKQAAVNALDSVLPSPALGAKQKEYAKAMIKEMEDTIPWSPQDVIAFSQQGDPKESFGEFAKSSGIQGAADRKPDQMAPSDAPEVSEEQYNGLPPGAAYRVPGNPKVMRKP
jgi:hypothetical protein